MSVVVTTPVPTPTTSAPARRPKVRTERLSARASNAGLQVAVIALTLAWTVPTLGLLINSFRSGGAFNTSGWWTALAPPFKFTLDSYRHVLGASDLAPSFFNSFMITIPATIIPTAIAAFAAYAFSWMKFWGRDWIFLALVGLLAVPLQLTFIPLLTLAVHFGLTSGNTLPLGLNAGFLAIWIAHTGYGLPFSIYLLANFFRVLPQDLFESAEIDGAGPVTVFFRLILPLSVPAIASLVIFQFLWVWNDLLVALIYIGGTPEVAPLTVTLTNLVGSLGQNIQYLTAAAFVSMIVPLIVFFALQRYFVRGILAGSVKG
ncbi:MAG TPA: carbohydrate ABC transporter permease [Candidatus Dormibacteraeota bacterium]|nr:carbohydrate ABC transporter permease [Candidatus Dormibacteraeota bacterium]